jgi:citrate lyase subunit beta/citryl-CoA lyase
VFPRITDDEGTPEETEFIKPLGFDGKSVIHPEPIPIIHEFHTPRKGD